MNRSQILITFSSSLLAILAGTFPGRALAAPYTLPEVPLIVSVESTPNVFMQMDDSGSMNWEILAPQHFTLCAYDGFASNRSYFTGNDTSGDVKSYCHTDGRDDRPAGDARMLSWFYREASNNPHKPRIRKDTNAIFYFGTSNDCANSNNVERCEDKMTRTGDADTKDMDMDWRIRSSSLNVVYFNPTSEYEPWVGGSTTYNDSDWEKSRSWPDSNEGDYNQWKDLGADGGFTYNIWIDDKGYSGTRPNRTDMTVGGNGEVDLWDTHVRVTVKDNNVECEQFSITSAGTNGMDADKTDITCTSAHTGGRSLAELQQNIANWFEYARRRVHVANYAMGKVLTELPDYRYGLAFINNGGVEIQMPDAAVTDYSAHITSILDNAYRDKEAAGQTPLRGGLDTAGKYYADLLNNVDSPIINSCQKNFTVLFTDGYWDDDTGNDDDADLTPVSDQSGDGDGAQIYGNNQLQSTTLSDVASYYYENDLRTDLLNAVPTDSFDSASHQHMVTFTINFGSAGLLTDTDDDGWPGAGTVPGNFDWYSNANTGTTLTSYWDPRKADDMWHAAWNSKGTYVAAGSPEGLVESFRDALENIGSRIGGAASAAANSGSISSTSRIFQAKFDTDDWHGELLAFPVNSDGTLGGSPIWNANTLLSAKSDSQLSSNAGGRDVWTWNNDSNTPTGTAFEWSSISTDQQALLNTDANGVTDNLGTDRLRYVRGDSSQEESNGAGGFRNRTHKMGDVVNSDPVYVGYPPFFYSFDNYQNFFNSYVGRTGVIYFGANDGMLHAIRESDGEELFAYVPDKVIANLPQLTDPDYSHGFYVDGKPEYGDVFINGSWKSVVASTLRAGGQGLFALDVTTPESFDANDVLWEFTDEVDADLGYTYSQPQIRRMANGKWAAIIGNGLNNTEADGHASTTGTGALFIIYIEEGINGWSSTDYVKITVPGGSLADPNAVFTPAAADIDGDNKVDTIYAGDRNGKMWKFDVSSSNSNQWALDFSGSALFDAGSGHPITDRPAIAAHPMGAGYGQLVIFGTGQYIQNADNTDVGQPTQSLYAIWDLSPALEAANHKAFGYARNELSSNSFSVQSGVRVIDSGNTASWFDNNNAPDDRGWYIDLPTAGERIVRRPVIRDNIIFFVSLIPDDDPCSAGGTGWLMVMDTLTGAAPAYPVFDIDGDLDVTRVGDMLDPNTPNDPSDDKTPAGVFSPSIPNLPAIIYDDRPGFSASYSEFPPVPNSARGCDAGSARAYTFTTGSNGSILTIETAAEQLSCGRQSWNSEK
ncbi:MAG: PilC/PilY family type IV pilus protein [Lysobacterales bacterium]